MLLGQPSCKCVRGCWQPCGKFVIGGQRVLATLWKFIYRKSEGISNPLTNSLEGIGNFGKTNTFVKEMPMPLDPWPEDID